MVTFRVIYTTLNKKLKFMKFYTETFHTKILSSNLSSEQLFRVKAQEELLFGKYISTRQDLIKSVHLHSNKQFIHRRTRTIKKLYSWIKMEIWRCGKQNRKMLMY